MVQEPDSPEYGSGPADSSATRDFWLECVKGADSRGHLDRIPTVKGTSKRGRDIAKKQNYALTRKVYMMPDTDWHERIFGGDAA